MPTRCPHCGKAQTAANRFCGDCGGSLHAVSVAVTTPPPAIDLDRTVELSTPVAPRASRDGGRYLPGVVLANRYRMVALLGRGGMGEVYRADDLMLGQPVALKFLPRAVERDPDRRERFLTEVRMSLRVTHPNVCRVYDIAQADGRHFLSMEYVDGEDLASLLRRIGRLPEDKAVEIARQLCAGLQAAHDEGVLHRDLKPANVMLDGRGRAKITDFGLAGATEGISGLEARAGTPQYMAPEQIAGRALSKQTDLYALGLVLYEVFTGKPAFAAANTLEELERRQHATPSSPALHVSGLDPTFERAILRCLNPDSSQRPDSAAELARHFSGTDPLAKALAAGETPSPEVVAQAGGSGALAPAVATLCLASVLVGLAGVWYMQTRYTILRYVPLTISRSQLENQAQATLSAIGYPTQAYQSVSGFTWTDDYFNFVMRRDQSATRWDSLSTVVPSPVVFFYRQSSAPLVPPNNFGYVGFGNPPMTVPGMTRLGLGPSGQLSSFEAVPPARADAGSSGAEPDWSTFFKLAGLSLADFTPVQPLFSPPYASDARRAWTKDDLRVEAASFAGKTVWFDIIPAWRSEWTPGTTPPTASQRFGNIVTSVIRIAGLVIALLLTRRHLNKGRGDTRGATTFALAFFMIRAGRSVVRSSTSIDALLAVWSNHLGAQLLDTLQVWLFYMAVEPYVRKFWPDTLIAWNRLIDGKLRDPMVGRHLLVGALFGIGFSAVFQSPNLIASLTGAAPQAPEPTPLNALSGIHFGVGSVLGAFEVSFFIPVALLLLVLVFRTVFRRPWLANVMLLLAVMGLFLVAPRAPATASVLIQSLVIAISILVLTRLGFLAMVVTVVYSEWPHFPLTLDTSLWYFPWAALTMACFALVAIYGFVISLGGQKLLKDPLEA